MQRHFFPPFSGESIRYLRKTTAEEFGHITVTSNPREESTETLSVIREELGFAWRIVICAFYISWWRTKHYLWFDAKLNKGAKIAAATAALILLFYEVMSSVFQREISVWLGRFAIVVLVPTALLLLVHRIQEMRKREKEVSFAGRVGTLVDALIAITGEPTRDKRE